MARFTRIELALKMKETGVVPVFYNCNIEICKDVVKACYNGGIRVFEFTNRGDFAHEVYAELEKWAATECPELILGVGSVIDSSTAALYMQMGANFIVSPILDSDMARVCNKRKVAWSPGCGSVTEVVKAHELGAEVVKIFPASQVGGPGFVKAVKAPMPYASIMPTGGVSPTHDNMKAWFEAGVHCVGMGSQLFPVYVIANKDWEYISNKCSEAIAMANQYRK